MLKKYCAYIVGLKLKWQNRRDQQMLHVQSKYKMWWFIVIIIDIPFFFHFHVRVPFRGLTRGLIQYLSGVNIFWKTFHRLFMIFPLKMWTYLTQIYFQQRQFWKNCTMAHWPLSQIRRNVWLSGTKVLFKVILHGYSFHATNQSEQEAYFAKTRTSPPANQQKWQSLPVHFTGHSLINHAIDWLQAGTLLKTMRCAQKMYHYPLSRQFKIIWNTIYPLFLKWNFNMTECSSKKEWVKHVNTLNDRKATNHNG